MLLQLSGQDRMSRCPKYATQKIERPCDDEIWDRIRVEFRPYNVFVNIPYVKSYAPLQAAIVATLLKVGLRPQLASLRSEGQPLRICKICEMMQISKYCISDISMSELHNIPFELGYFYALGRQGHSFILVDEKYHEIEGSRVRKFDSRLSNLKGTEAIVHQNNPDKLVPKLVARITADVPEAQVPDDLKLLAHKIRSLAGRVMKALENETLADFVQSYQQLQSAARRGKQTTDL